MNRLLFCIACCCVVGNLAIQSGCQKRNGPDQSNSQRFAKKSSNSSPNIILIYSDDIDCESIFSTWPEQPSDLIRFPNLKRLAKRGTIFSNFHVTTPVCGPSRASLLSGQYAHTNGVKVNTSNVLSANGFQGGYDLFNRQRELGIWMKDAGYQTAFVGKYLHDGFSPKEELLQNWKDVIPEGWETFICHLGGNYLNFARVVNDSNSLERVEDEYRTDSEAKAVCDLIGSKLASSDRPFFLCWTPYAAHISKNTDEMTAPRHAGMFEDEAPSGRDQAGRIDFKHQPEEMAMIPAYEEAALMHWTKTHRHRMRSIQALDEGIGQMLEKLEATGQLENTIILFTSDHGFSNGQHRHFGKRFPYDRITKVPFIACGPGIPANQQCDQLLANIDIAPTLVALAGGKRPVTCDGISFVGLLRNPDQQLHRNGIVIENWDRIWSNRVQIEAAFVSLRSHHHIYTEWASGSYEYFDLENDPDQLKNLYPDLDEAKKAELDQALRTVRSRGADANNAQPTFGSEFKYPVEHEERKVFSANFVPATFSGFVEDDKGVQQVQLELYCEKIQSWWNGERWTTQQALVPAVVPAKNGHITRWSYTLDTNHIAYDPNERMNRRDVVVNVVATDQEGNKTRWEDAFAFRLKVGDPETWMDVPEPWTDRSQPFRLSGRAADNFELKQVDLLIVDLDRDLFWDESKREWVKERTLFQANMNRIESDQPGDWAEWSYEFNGPQVGRIFFCARGFDAKGNFDMSVSFQIVQPPTPYEEKQEE